MRLANIWDEETNSRIRNLVLNRVPVSGYVLATMGELSWVSQGKLLILTKVNAGQRSCVILLKIPANEHYARINMDFLLNFLNQSSLNLQDMFES